MKTFLLSLIAIVFFASSPLFALEPFFNTSLAYYSDGQPPCFASADFDNDGDPDMASGGWNRIIILKNNGDASFEDWAGYPSDTSPSSICAADLDNDGDIDLAAANMDTNVATVFINNGDGSFTTRYNYAVGDCRRASICAGEFNSDGYVDLAVANSSSNNISILINNGNGTFRIAVNYPVGQYPTSIAAADFNSDGVIDLAVANYDSRSVSILFNDGHGAFENRTDYDFPYDAGPFSLCTADLDSDHDIDIAVGNFDNATISIMKNSGNGMFQIADTYVSHIRPFTLTVGDINNDGALDLVTAVLIAEIFTNDGNGAFRLDGQFLLGSASYQVIVKDLDGDSNNDIASVSWDAEELVIAKNDGAGNFPAPAMYYAGDWANAVAAADFNGDGDIDVAATNARTDSIAILENNGDGTFQGARKYFANWYPDVIVNADFDGDGDQDLATLGFTEPSYISILLNDGNGVFTQTGTYPVGDDANSIFAADLDGDSDIDLITANQSSNTISVLKNNGNGTFQSKQDYAAGIHPYGVFGGDFDGDGDIDLVVSKDQGNSVYFYRNNGSGVFTHYATYETGDGTGPMEITGADFDGDGDFDLAIGLETVATIVILQNDGHGNFHATQNLWVHWGFANFAMDTPDIDSDGDKDLAVIGLFCGTVCIFLNDGLGTFSKDRLYVASDHDAEHLKFADFNGDSKPDLVAGNIDFAAVSILMNSSGPAPLTGAIAGNVINADNGLAVCGVLVSALQNGWGRGSNVTDSLGAFIISDILPGSYDVMAFKNGFEPDTLGNIAISANETTQVEISLEPLPSCVYVPGDINGDTRTNGLDIVYAVAYFKGGNTPPDTCNCPPIAYPFYGAGDANGNCSFNGIDITYYVRYLKGDEPSILYCRNCPPAEWLFPAKEPEPLLSTMVNNLQVPSAGPHAVDLARTVNPVSHHDMITKRYKDILEEMAARPTALPTSPNRRRLP